jgi:hypothetical protein
VAVAGIVGGAVGEPVGEPVGDGVVVTVGGVADGDGEGETTVGLVGVALGFNTTKGTTLVSVTCACGVRNESAHDIGVRMSGRTGAKESGKLFVSRYSPGFTFEEISAETLQLGIRRIAIWPANNMSRMPSGRIRISNVQSRRSLNGSLIDTFPFQS